MLLSFANKGLVGEDLYVKSPDADHSSLDWDEWKFYYFLSLSLFQT